MQKITCYLTFLLLFAVSQAFAQKHKCGVTFEMGLEIMEQMIQNRNEMRDFVNTRNTTVYLPVRFFLVAKSDGTGRTSETAALKGLCLLNENYADQEIQFYLKEFKYVNNTLLYENPGGAKSVIEGQMNSNYDAINVFVVDQIGDSDDGVTLAYWDPPAGPNGDDWLVAAEVYVDDFEVLTHEVGHFFSLNHTFFGWESTGGWENTQWSDGSSVGINSPAGPNVKNERADGSNCATSADRICDTPADYLFNYNPNCQYSDNAKDPSGILINPDPHNFMNYNNTPSCVPDLYFSDEQKDEIAKSLNSFSRSYVPKDHIPNTNEITNSPTLEYPLSQDPPMPYNSVNMQWTAVEHADKYLLEVRKPSSQPQRFIVEGANNFTVTTLEPETTYFWKVQAFNEYRTCDGASGQRFFKTGSDMINDTNEIPELKDWIVQPNPVKSGEMLNISFESSESITLDINLMAITGQMVANYKDQVLGSGNSVFSIETAGFPAGVYLVSVRTPDGVSTQRVSII